jgi:hypothetical protein
MHMRSIGQCADVYSEYGQEHQPSRIWIFVIPLNLLTYVWILIKLHHRHSFNLFLSTHNYSTIFLWIISGICGNKKFSFIYIYSTDRERKLCLKLPIQNSIAMRAVDLGTDYVFFRLISCKYYIRNKFGPKIRSLVRQLNVSVSGNC